MGWLVKVFGIMMVVIIEVGVSWMCYGLKFCLWVVLWLCYCDFCWRIFFFVYFLDLFCWNLGFFVLLEFGIWISERYSFEIIVKDGIEWRLWSMLFDCRVILKFCMSLMVDVVMRYMVFNFEYFCGVVVLLFGYLFVK